METKESNKKLRKGSINDPYCIDAVKVCMTQNLTDEQSLSTLLTMGISMNKRMLTRIKERIRYFKNIKENNPSQREQIRAETEYLNNEQIQKMLHIQSQTKDNIIMIKASHMIENLLFQRLKLYRFPLHD